MLNKIFKTMITLLMINIVAFNSPVFAAKKEEQNIYKMLDLFGYVLDQIKKEYVEEVPNNELIEAAINGMLSSLDPHSSYLNDKSFTEMSMQTKGEFGGLGIEVTSENGLIKIISPIDDTPAFELGIKSGDYIIEVNNESVVNMSLTEAVDKMRGKPGTKVHITILREDLQEPLEFTITRKLIKVKSVKAIDFDNIVYIRIAKFSEQTTNEIKTEFTKIKNKVKKINGIILDLRNNPGGLLDQAREVTDLFLDSGEIVSTKGRDSTNITRYNATKGTLIKNIPIVVLINEGSASAAEIVAGALQDHKKAIIMGVKSFGKGSVQVVKPLPAGYGAMKITNALFYTPSGKSIQAEGIIPDIEVEQLKVESTKKDNKGRKVFSEATLKKHLKSKGGKMSKKNNPYLNNKSDGKAVEEKIKVLEEKIVETLLKDYQLSRAIDLIKGMYLFNYNIVNNPVVSQ